jgi:hypothetical protein
MADAHLEHMRQRALDNRQLAERLITGMSVAQLGWNPAPRSWSPIEVLEHLNNAAEKYQRLIQGCIERSREHKLHDAGDFRPGWFQGWLIKQLEPKPKSRALPAPSAFRPVAGSQVDPRIRDRFFELSDSLCGLLGDAEGVSLSRVRFPSPISPLVRFNLGESFWLLVAHEHRHLLQIQRICSHPQYPRS